MSPGVLTPLYAAGGPEQEFRNWLVDGLYKTVVTRGLVSSAAKAKVNCNTCNAQYHLSLYIQLTISFLIGQKRTVNFRNQHLGVI